MSTTIPELTAQMQAILETQAAATQRSSGFVQRCSKLTGPLFAQTLVFGWWSDPNATLDDLTDTAAALGCDLSPQALDARFTPAAATFLRGLLDATLRTTAPAPPVALALLQRFRAVFVADGTVIGLPAAWHPHWPGCGNGTGPAAALKLVMRLDLLQGGLDGVLCAGRVAARTAARDLPPGPVGALHLRDLGFFHIAQFAAWGAVGDFWLSRLLPQVSVFTADGTALDVGAWLTTQTAAQGARTIQLGREQHLGCRLLWERVPAEVVTARRAALAQDTIDRGVTVSARAWALAPWTLLVTNTTATQLAVAEALVLARARWEVELLFKRWKSLGQVDEWRSQKAGRILCEVYAKLIGLLLQHRIVAQSCWALAERSLVRAQRRLRHYGLLLASAWGRAERVARVLRRIARRLGQRCVINRRATEPALYQLLADPSQLAANHAARVARLRKAQAAGAARCAAQAA